MLHREKIQNLIDRHLELEKKLSSGSIDKKKFAEISKEYSDLNDIIKYAKEYLNYQKDKDDLHNIINDKGSDEEMREFATSELENLKTNYLINEKKLNCFCFQRILQIAKMRSLKLEQVQAGLKQVFLLRIYLKCMKKLVKKKNGLLK